MSVKLRAEFIDPVFMRNLPSEGEVRNGVVIVGDQRLTFADANETYPDGTPVEVWCGQYFLCQSLTEREQERQEKEQRQQERERQNIIWQELERQRVMAYNAALTIPVRWFPEIKHRLGGLTVNSMGNGWCRNSVVHVYLLEEVCDGRFHRNAGDFLCTQQQGNHFGELIREEHAKWNRQHMKVTCQACLRLLARWQ